MEALIILAFVLLAGFFFVILSRLQRGSSAHKHDASCNHDHSHCDQDHDHKDGGCCGGHH
ncbi:MAG: hypothetical protein H7Y43_16205 [Akkermansiaceae bacterium]|nr:hypothetical protein [Verrucomicrobiales bacterium]